MKALITGATGPIGIALCDDIVARGGSVVALVRKVSPRAGVLDRMKDVTVIPCSLEELSGAEHRTGRGFDTFFHLGWSGTESRETRDSAEVQARNIGFTLDAVRLARAAGCTCFVGVGSHSECGPISHRIGRRTRIRPIESYGVAKFAAGWLSRRLCEDFGLRHCWGRVLSTYGPHDRETTLIMYCIRTLLARRIPALTAGEQRWDYLFSRDCARALYLMALNGRHGGVYALGSGESRSLADYIRCLRDRIDPSLPLGFGQKPYPAGQIMHLCADTSDLRSETGFSPEWPFEQGIEATIAWVVDDQGRKGRSPHCSRALPADGATTGSARSGRKG